MANYPCLLCKIHKNVLRTQTVEDLSILRDFHQYIEDTININSSESGIKQVCIWNKIQ